ncbi:hypothetical protein [Marispirochaeta sp.]|uniref:hypothetical protein n=1 Tax=Marispirochaeta sp. TaxID=2038653 RepID=UPI0029C8E8BE|nr:hypothetical protein [Marispirochaeta sp.]
MTATAQDYRKKIEVLPKHDQKAIDVATNQLEMLHASFYTGTMDLNLKKMSKDDVLKTIDSIESMDAEKMRSSWMFEPPFDSSDPEGWLKQARLIRIAYLTEQYELLSRLRDDDPEAWDEINELYFDD